MIFLFLLFYELFEWLQSKDNRKYSGFFVLFFGRAAQHAGSSLTRDWTRAPCSGSAES